MNKFLENVMSFINENTTLLIVICVFLIFVLIGYLIDNSIKTKKLAKMEKNVKKEDVINNTIPEVKEEIVSETPVVVEETKEVTPEPVVTVKEEETSPVQVEEVKVEEPVIIPDSITEAEDINVKELEPVEVKATEMEVDPAINELLNKDFTSNNNVINYETSFEEENVSVEKSPEPKEEKNLYKNDKSLSEIFGKKNVDTVKEDNKELLNTVDFQNELDRILQKLNDESDSQSTKDSTLDETQDFSNMF